MMENLLIVGERKETQALLSRELSPEYNHIAAHDRVSALRAFRDMRPPVVVLDLESSCNPDIQQEQLAIVLDLMSIEPLTKVIILGEGDGSELAKRAVAIGAYDILDEPANTDKLKLVLARSFYVARLERERREMNLWLRCDSCEGLLGACLPMQSVFAAIRQVAITEAPVLITGESGTGKEMTARAIHLRSSRKNGPFETVNCAAISENQWESELFGHEKEAFAGAHEQRKGRIESSSGGTLFLDEIAGMPSVVQMKLPRFLQERTIERVGGRQPVEVDARVVAASNRDVKRALATGRLREELYYRIAVVQINLPPLRERGEDIVLLARAFLHVTERVGKREVTFTEEALRALRQHTWPGNVRELQSRIRHAVTTTEGSRISADDLFEDPRLGSELSFKCTSLRKVRERVDRDMILQALRSHGGNITAASVGLGISRPTLYTMMQKLGIERNT